MTRPEPLTPEDVSENCDVSASQAAEVLDYLVEEGWMLGKFIEFRNEDELDDGRVQKYSRISSILGFDVLDPSNHRAHGVTSKCLFWAKTQDGSEVTVWGGVEPGSASYEVKEEHKYAVEVNQDDVMEEGRAFSNRYTADLWAFQKMMYYGNK